MRGKSVWLFVLLPACFGSAGVLAEEDPSALNDHIRLLAAPSGHASADTFRLFAAAAVPPPPYWTINGNSGSNPSTNFLGTTDNQPLIIRVNNTRVLRLDSLNNFLAGNSGNSLSLGVQGSTIFGGSASGANQVTDDFGVVGGGYSNRAGNANGLLLDAEAATVGGGRLNVASAPYSVVAGGIQNLAAGNYAGVAGGSSNSATGAYSAVSGGYQNYASGDRSAIPGGYNNQAAGLFSFAAGYQAIANHAGTFVWSDPSSATPLSSTAPNQFLIRATGGVGIGTDAPAAPLDVNGVVRSSSGGFRFPDNSMQLTAAFGTITGVIAGTGLAGGGAVGNVTLGIANAGVGAAQLQPGAVETSNISTVGASSPGQVLTFTGSSVAWQSPAPLDQLWSLTGNSGTTAGTNFLGTTDNQPLEIKVNGTRILRLEPSNNLIAGFNGNNRRPGVIGATISGGGSESEENVVSDDFGTIGGGSNNRAGDSSGSTSDMPFATVNGGKANVASGLYSTIGGGDQNIAGPWATVAGGHSNVATGNHSVVAGGAANTASGDAAVALGGNLNEASGTTSVAAGFAAKANHGGTFVWSDLAGPFASTGNNQFLIHATGGVGIGTNTPAAPLDVDGVIRSRAGGFRFPDGTTQTTAQLVGPQGPPGADGPQGPEGPTGPSGLDFVRTVVVSPIGSDGDNGTALLNALAGITTASSANPWLLKVEPGVYDLGGATLAMKPYVDVEGSGTGVTRITSSGGTTVDGANSAELRQLTVISVGGSNSTAIRNSSVSPRIVNVTAVASGGTHNAAVTTQNSSAVLRDVTLLATASPGTIAYGLRNQALSSPSLERVQITATGGFNSYGILNETSELTMTDSTVLSSGASNDSKGIFNANIDSANHSVSIRSSLIDATGIGITNVPALGTTYSVKIDASRIRGGQLAVYANGPQVMIGASRVEGGVNSAGPGLIVCAGVFDAAYSFFANTCP